MQVKENVDGKTKGKFAFDLKDQERTKKQTKRTKTKKKQKNIFMHN